jgi:SpoVK/Ycf46/Vps4 family AAA+-type ATPase
MKRCTNSASLTGASRNETKSKRHTWKLGLLAVACVCSQSSLASAAPSNRRLLENVQASSKARETWLHRVWPLGRTRTTLAKESERIRTTNQQPVIPPPAHSDLPGMDPQNPQALRRNQREEHEASEEDYCEATAVSPITAVAGFVSSLLQDPRRLGRWTVSGVQIGLVFFLGHALWQAISEVVEEYSQEIAGNEPAFVKRDEAARTVAFFEMDPTIAQKALAEVQKGKSSSKIAISIPTLQIAQKLVASGLPLRSRQSEASVESILPQLSKAEVSLLHQCLWTPPLSKSNTESNLSLWKNIIGLDDVKERLLSALKTIKGENSKSFSALFDGGGSSSGVLLYGPPGCGKTLLVKALASTARIPCLVVTPSVLLRKYYGETNAQVRSLFSLAAKLSPCILCIDELDGLFRERSEQEHEVSRDLKTEFLQWVDGMMSKDDANRQILLVGATNRPFDCDSAVLRRMSQSHFVGLPDLTARSVYLKHALRSVPITNDFDFNEIACRSEGYSPSDLRQLLQTAAISGPMQEATALLNDSATRPLSATDVLAAFRYVSPTPLSPQYRYAMTNFARSASSNIPATGEGKWQTGWGNFYDVGTLEVDHSTFVTITDLLKDVEDPADDSGDGDDLE